MDRPPVKRFDPLTSARTGQRLLAEDDHRRRQCADELGASERRAAEDPRGEAPAEPRSQLIPLPPLDGGWCDPI